MPQHNLWTYRNKTDHTIQPSSSNSSDNYKNWSEQFVRSKPKNKTIHHVFLESVLQFSCSLTISRLRYQVLRSQLFTRHHQKPTECDSVLLFLNGFKESEQIRLNSSLQKRFTFFVFLFLHLQQPAVTSLPQEGGSVRIFTAVAAHVQLNVGRADGATQFCGKNDAFRWWAFLKHANTQQHDITTKQEMFTSNCTSL